VGRENSIITEGCNKVAARTPTSMVPLLWDRPCAPKDRLTDWSNNDGLTGSFSGGPRVFVDEAVEPLLTHDHAAIWDRLRLGIRMARTPFRSARGNAACERLLGRHAIAAALARGRCLGTQRHGRHRLGMPRLHGLYWPRLAVGPRGAGIAVMAAIVLMPTGFASWRATTWQFPTDQSIDHATFNRPDLLAMKDAPTLESLGTDAQYQFSLRFGPRGYENYFHQARDLDAGPVRVTAALWQQAWVIVWCSAYLDRLESPNQITAPQQFPAAFKRMTFTTIPVQCRGPAAAASSSSTDGPIIVRWHAEITLIGDRLRQARNFDGSGSS